MSYSEFEVETALCLWEAYLKSGYNEYPQLTKLQEQEGICVVRERIMGLAQACAKSYSNLSKKDGFSFDLDFCPNWLSDLDDLSTMEVFEDFMKKTNEDMVKRYGLESDDE